MSGSGSKIPAFSALSLANLKFGGVGFPNFISKLHLSTISWVLVMASGISANSRAISSGDLI